MRQAPVQAGFCKKANAAFRRKLFRSNHRTPTPPSSSAQPGIQFVNHAKHKQSPLPSRERARVRGRCNEQTRLPPARSVAARGDLLSGIAQKIGKEASPYCPPDFSSARAVRAKRGGMANAKVIFESFRTVSLPFRQTSASMTPKTVEAQQRWPQGLRSPNSFLARL